jgi:hypothetical protein
MCSGIQNKELSLRTETDSCESAALGQLIKYEQLRVCSLNLYVIGHQRGENALVDLPAPKDLIYLSPWPRGSRRRQALNQLPVCAVPISDLCFPPAPR